ncbi:hypothetical protein GCM10009001_20270 [Virgibacillus siamensis]|uniref:Uncharacterized protein n=1 Tax=Virgibacillus siamensis TaxID=480071 RepID=A0ABN1G3A0_9BACI
MSWYVLIVLIIGSIPIGMFVNQGIKQNNGIIDKIDKKKPILVYVILSLLALIVHVYMYNEHGIPIFPAFYNIKYMLLGIFLIFGILTVITLIVDIRNKKMWMIILYGTVIGLLFFVWLMPTGKKITYTIYKGEAIKELQDNEDDFSMVWAVQTDDCMIPKNCHDKDFYNTFYIKNSTDDTHKLKAKIKAYNEEDEIMETVTTDIHTLGPGESTLLTTEETNKKASIWDQYSFETEKLMDGYWYEIWAVD